MVIIPKNCYNNISFWGCFVLKNNTFLEKPIVNKSEDLFNISSYVEDLENAIADGAKFIAIDGEYGSGKSSLVNILKNNEIKTC